MMRVRNLLPSVLRAGVVATIVFVASGAPAADAFHPTAEDASARQQSRLREALGLDCGRAESSSEVVVCGTREPSPYRLPLDSDPEPGARLAGEAVDQREALALNPKPCSAPRQRPGSNGLEILAVAATAAMIAANLADPDREKPEPRPAKTCG